MVVAVFPGQFDPVTYGHLDIISRAAPLFEQIIVGVRVASQEKLLFNLSERLAMVEEFTRGSANVLVIPYCEPLLEFVQRHQARVIIRDLGSFSDFEQGLGRAKLSKKLFPEIETIFITCRPELFCTSEMVKEVASFGGDIASFVPPSVETRVYRKLCSREQLKDRVII